jgi:hypothetical protein
VWGNASPATPAQTGKSCASDIKTLCAGIQPGEGRIKACIKSHLIDLSPTAVRLIASVKKLLDRGEL